MQDRYSTILTEATRLFADRGYPQTTVRDIATAVDLLPGSLYTYITTKEELLRAIVFSASSAFENTTLPLLNEPNLPPTNRLRNAIHAHLATIATHRAAAKVFFHDWTYLSPPARSEASWRRRKYEQAFASVLEEGATTNEFRPHDSKLLAIAILGLLNWSHTWFRPDGRLNMSEIADHFSNLILDGLRHPNGPSFTKS